MTATTSPESLDDIVTGLLQAEDRAVGTLLRELMAHGASRTTADSTVDALVRRGAVIRTANYRLALAPTTAASSAD